MDGRLAIRRVPRKGSQATPPLDLPTCSRTPAGALRDYMPAGRPRSMSNAPNWPSVVVERRQ
jgi:hypothetical protein